MIPTEMTLQKIPTVSDFLKSLRTSAPSDLQTVSVESNKTITVVSGNESADLDSIVSAIAFSYGQYLKDEKLVIPIINIPKADLSLRKDVVYVLSRANITEDLLFFQEDLFRFKNKFGCYIKAILVDHNEIPYVVKSLIDEVVGIIDHHTDVGVYLKANPRVFTTCGSCSSLVFNYWNKLLGKEEKKSFDTVIPLTIGGLLIDTANFTHKVEQPDKVAMNTYLDEYNESRKNKYFKIIRGSKDDIEGFTLHDLLRKDYKQYAFGLSEDNTKSETILGFSTIVKPIEWLYEQHGGQEKFTSLCCEYLKEMKVEMLIIMTSWIDVNQDDKFRRQFIVLSCEKRTIDMMQELIKKLTPSLKLTKSNQSPLEKDGVDKICGCCLRVYDQLNTIPSRKNVIPLVRDAFGTI